MKKGTYVLSLLLTLAVMPVSFAQDWPSVDMALRPCYLIGNFRHQAMKNTDNLQLYRGVAPSSPTTWTPILNSSGSNVWSTDNNGTLCVGQALNLPEGQTLIVTNQAQAGYLMNPLLPIVLLSESVDASELPTARVAQAGGLEAQYDKHHIMLYPNPVAGSVTLSYQLDQPQAIEVVLHTLTGQPARTLLKQSQAAAGKHAHTFQLSGLPSGVYACEVRVGAGKRQVLKLVKTQGD